MGDLIHDAERDRIGVGVTRNHCTPRTGPETPEVGL